MVRWQIVALCRFANGAPAATLALQLQWLVSEKAVEPEDPSAQLVRSSIRRKAQSLDYLDTVDLLIENSSPSRDKLKVLAESSAITFARI